MSGPDPHSQSTLPVLHRVVTGHNKSGSSCIQYDTSVVSEDLLGMNDIKTAAMWVITDPLPTNDNNNTEDGATRIIKNPACFDLLPPTGTALRTTDLAPGATTPMHRTASLDHNILLSGQIILILEDGTETTLQNPGDAVIQRGTMHAWRNPGSTWARWATVLVAAEPANVNGEVLASAIGA